MNFSSKFASIRHLICFLRTGPLVALLFALFDSPLRGSTAVDEATGMNLLRQNPVFAESLSAQAIHVLLSELAIPDFHEEFALPSGTSRILPLESDMLDPEASANRNHATHVAGLIAAEGINPELRGMAPQANLLAVRKQSPNDILKLGCPFPGDPLTAQIGNTSLTAEALTGVVGAYGQRDYDMDNALMATPYYLQFYPSGNTGNAFASLPPESKEAKNIITVTAANNASRDAAGVLDSPVELLFTSSRGPTLDGRIKPDLAAPGSALISTNGTDSSATLSGTSMATAVASGTAAALQGLFQNRFPGHLLRAPTLKAILLHSADDVGNPGPDYSFGWGYLNAFAAAHLIEDYFQKPAAGSIIEDRILANAFREYTFSAEAGQPIKVTLAWFEAGGIFGASDTMPDLIWDLNLEVEDPAGTVWRPWVMPFVINGLSPADYDTPATTGINSNDTIEQVYIPSAPLTGSYTIRVSHVPSIFFPGKVDFSLIVAGMNESTPARPQIASVSTNSLFSDGGDFLITGSHFLPGVRTFLKSSSGILRQSHAPQVLRTQIQCLWDVEDLPPGDYSLIVENPDGSRATLQNAIRVQNRANLFSEDFDNASDLDSIGWSPGNEPGATPWTIETAKPLKGSQSLSMSSDGQTPIAWLITPSISIPAGIDEPLHFSFQQTIRREFSMTTNADAELPDVVYPAILLQIDGGEWLDAGSTSGFTLQSETGEYAISPNPASGTVGLDLKLPLRSAAILDPNLVSGKSIAFALVGHSGEEAPRSQWTIDDVRLAARDPLLPGILNPPQSLPGSYRANNLLFPAISFDRPTGGVEAFPGSYLIGRLLYRIEEDVFPDSEVWSSASGNFLMVGSPLANGDGTERVEFRSTTPLNPETRPVSFLRIVIDQLPPDWAE